MRLQHVLFLAAMGISSAAMAQHTDVQPRVTGGKIFTDAFDDATADLTPDVRVFGFDFGEDPLDPHFASDPGFNAPAGSGLPALTSLIYNILSGPATSGTSGNLAYWNGIGTVTLGAAPVGTSIRLNLGSQNRLIDSSTTEVAGFSLGTTDANGAVHRHVNAFLEKSGGGNPANGIYIFAMELAASGAQDSDPFWIVYNAGLSEELHDEAIDLVNEALVPEPASLGLASIGAFAWMLKRRGK